MTYSPSGKRYNINKRKHCIPEENKTNSVYSVLLDRGHVGIAASGFSKGLAKFWHFIKSR